MHALNATNASGRQVSLLNDDVSCYDYPSPYQASPYASYPAPNTPELLRSDSYDSQMSSEPLTPTAPSYHDYQVSYANSAIDSRGYYEDYADPSVAYQGAKRPRTFSHDRRSISYEDDASASPGSERPGKRYPCRYRDLHGCEKTFTTSGHASRHSKIHTAEKGVPCTWEGCSKKFTRADNMKQHLETHYKDKGRSSRPSLSSSERKSSVSGKSSSRSSKLAAATISSSVTPLPSPGGVFDMRGLRGPLDLRPSVTRTPTGLDTLAMAVACQEGA